MADTKEWVDWQNTKVLQKIAIVDKDGNVLVLKRSKYKPTVRQGKWDLPGGSVLSDDLQSKKPLRNAILREIEEETGLSVIDVILTFIDSWVFEKSVGKVLGVAIGYAARVDEVKPKVKLSKEHAESVWSSKEKTSTLDFGDDGGLHLSIIERV